MLRRLSFHTRADERKLTRLHGLELSVEGLGVYMEAQQNNSGYTRSSSSTLGRNSCEGLGGNTASAESMGAAEGTRPGRGPRFSLMNRVRDSIAMEVPTTTTTTARMTATRTPPMPTPAPQPPPQEQQQRFRVQEAQEARTRSDSGSKRGKSRELGASARVAMTPVPMLAQMVEDAFRVGRRAPWDRWIIGARSAEIVRGASAMHSNAHCHGRSDRPVGPVPRQRRHLPRAQARGGDTAGDGVD